MIREVMNSFFKHLVIQILSWEARLVLKRYKPRIIAVTGSVGKTTTKDAIYAALSRELHVRKSEKSYNGEIGVPLTILGCQNAWSSPLKWIANIAHGLGVLLLPGRYPAWLVLELGADRPGDIRRLAKWIRPDIAVITGVPEIPVHVEYFKSPEEVLKEKRALAEYLRPGGKLILNGDDPRTKEIHSSFRGASITYGMEADSDFYASHDEVVYEDGNPVGMRFRINHSGSSVPVSIRGALGRPRIYAASAAIAVSDCIGIDAVAALDSLSHWSPTPGRARIIPGIKGATLIDDTYNSSPAAAFAALDTLKSVAAERGIAILGDMMELGKYSAEAHRAVGERAVACADLLITVGFRSRVTAEAALDAGMPDLAIRQYEQNDIRRAADELLVELKKGDVILIKGSQSMRMERLVEALMAEPLRSSELLVRMEPEWQMR
jgi:UDP-N-acetylmuramoyl-tripeptide--D-alanyl-D-alanine ligase